MSDLNYIVKFIMPQRTVFTIWISSEENDFFLKQNDDIVFFYNKEKLYEFCRTSKIKIESESVYDFTVTNYDDYNAIIEKWNIISDLSNTMNLSFCGDSDDVLPLYKKILCACNLPALNKSDNVYIPEFSDIEKEHLAFVIKNMNDILEQVFPEKGSLNFIKMKKKIGFLLLLVVFSFSVFSKKAESKGFSGIVFWKLDDEYWLNSVGVFYPALKANHGMLLELYENKKSSVAIPFDEYCEFDKSKLEFSFSNIDVWSRDFVLKYNWVNEFFAIVINDEIVLMGLNRIGYYGASIPEGDDCELPFITNTYDGKLKLVYYYSYLRAQIGWLYTEGMEIQQKDLEKIDCAKIAEFFKR